MAVPTVRVADQSLDIVAATPIQYDFPLKDENEVEVIYGKDCHTADLGADYTVTLAVDYLSFTITPTAALLAKINALIGLDATEINYITVRRTQSPLTEANLNDIRLASFLLNQVERLHMHIADIWENSWRTLMFKRKNVGTPQDAVYVDDFTTPGATLVVGEDGASIEEGATLEEVEGWKDDAEAAADTATTQANAAIAARAQADADAIATAADRVVVTATAATVAGYLVTATNIANTIAGYLVTAAAYVASALTYRNDAEGFKNTAAAAAVSTAADAVATAADRVATAADAISSAASAATATAQALLAQAAAAMDATLTDIAASGNLVINTSYLVTGGGLVVCTLPAVAAKGSKIRLLGNGAGGWSIAQGAGQQIIFGDVSSTAGAGGSLASTNRYDCLTMRCVVADTTWQVEHAVGNITIV